MSIHCKAAITDGNGNFSIEIIEVSDPDEDEILVKVKAAGLCHTDSDSLHWGHSMVMGHEGAGIVVKTGSNVKNISENDPVILNWATPCYQCYQCEKGNPHLCEINSPVVAGANGFTPGHAERSGTRWNGETILRSFNLGTFSEYTLVKESAAVRNHSVRMPYTTAAIIGCGVMTGYGSVMNAAQPEPGSSIVVLGAGGVGLSVIQSAKLSGAARIIAVDINSDRLAMARKFGATDIIQADRADQGLLHAATVVKQLVGDRGADYAFECTAVPELGAAPTGHDTQCRDGNTSKRH
jgi:S-(hydroxymethyl)glutathione dehydrogenase / alcohol dehydrogenase